MPLVNSSPPVAMPASQARSAGLGASKTARHPPPPETLHPSLWLGHQLGRQPDQAVASGFPALDAELPGGGWPRRVLSELLLPHPGVGEIRLLSPSLVSVQQAGRLVMLFDPPEELCAWALAQMGLAVDQLLVIHTRCKVVAGSDSLWALEQALKSGHVGAVLAWLPPRLRTERLRRLQLAAHAHDGPAFVIRETAAQQRPTSAPLRLVLKPGGADVLNVRVLKRRGPPLETALQLPLPPVLSAAARLRAAQPMALPGMQVPALPSGEVLQAATFINLARY